MPELHYGFRLKNILAKIKLFKITFNHNYLNGIDPHHRNETYLILLTEYWLWICQNSLFNVLSKKKFYYLIFYPQYTNIRNLKT